MSISYYLSFKRFDSEYPEETSEKPLSHLFGKMEVRKAIFLFCAAVLVEHRHIIMRGASLFLQEGALCRVSTSNLPGQLAKAEQMEHQASLYHL